MNTKVLDAVDTSELKEHPDFRPGDTLEVSTVIREGDKQRIQVFRGIVVAMRGSGPRKTFTIRKISHGVGVEKILPLHSPNIEKIKLVKKGDVRRAKLYYMRERVGKQAMKTGEGMFGEDDVLETMVEEVAAPEEKPETVKAEKEEKPADKKEEKKSDKKEEKAEKTDDKTEKKDKK